MSIFGDYGAIVYLNCSFGNGQATTKSTGFGITRLFDAEEWLENPGQHTVGYSGTVIADRDDGTGTIVAEITLDGALLRRIANRITQDVLNSPPKQFPVPFDRA